MSLKVFCIPSFVTDDIEFNVSVCGLMVTSSMVVTKGVAQ